MCAFSTEFKSFYGHDEPGPRPTEQALAIDSINAIPVYGRGGSKRGATQVPIANRWAGRALPRFPGHIGSHESRDPAVSGSRESTLRDSRFLLESIASSPDPKPADFTSFEVYGIV